MVIPLKDHSHSELKEILTSVLENHDFIPDGDFIAGWYDRSISCRVRKENNIYWAQLRQQGQDKAENWIASNNIRLPDKPTLLETVNVGHMQLWIFDYIDDQTVSTRAWPLDLVSLDDRWWSKLQQSLDIIQQSHTNLVSVSDELILRRLKEFFDFKPQKLPTRQVMHGDLHWGNIGRNNATIYDWESYGTGPMGYDIALLYCYSLQQPELRTKIEQLFDSLLNSYDFQVTLLFKCAEILNMMARYPKLEHLRTDITSLANKYRAILSG